MEACDVPLGGFTVNFPVELEGELILLFVADAVEGKSGLGEFNFLVLDVPERHFKVDLVLTLGPLDNRVPKSLTKIRHS